jgi:hypothetical protein
MKYTKQRLNDFNVQGYLHQRPRVPLAVRVPRIEVRLANT